jgi:phospholipid/cholesterol/gamma-HCH transport system ATP-binding protein
VSDALIVARGLVVGYGHTPILEPLDFTIRRGTVHCILGGSGSGKSTVLRTLIGLQPKLGGEVTLDLAPAHGLPAEAPRFGVLFQSGALFGSLTLAQNIALPLTQWTSFDVHEVEAIVHAKLRLVGLERFENHLPAEISGGMKKRAGIARALALEPPLLFLDEPSAGLDPVATAELDRLMVTLRDELGMTLVVVTHELESVLRAGDACMVIDPERKRIVGSGAPRELKASSTDPYVRSFLDSFFSEFDA